LGLIEFVVIGGGRISTASTAVFRALSADTEFVFRTVVTRFGNGDGGGSGSGSGGGGGVVRGSGGGGGGGGVLTASSPVSAPLRTLPLPPPPTVLDPLQTLPTPSEMRRRTTEVGCLVVFVLFCFFKSHFVNHCLHCICHHILRCLSRALFFFFIARPL
jgi:hypothetical protein